MQDPSPRYFAHRREADGALQPILEHLSGTAALAESFADAFGFGEFARYVALMHDIGKYSHAFQRRLLGSPDRVDHSTAGAQECLKARNVMAAFCVAGHHAGLPNFGARHDTQDMATLFGRSRRQVADCADWRKELSPEVPPVPGGSDCLYQFFLTHMLFSCLVDADFLDTERFMGAGRQKRASGESIDALNERFDYWRLEDKKWQRPSVPLYDMTLNQMRSHVFYACMDAGAALSPGLFTLTVPTGGGKTTASLAFALRHAHSFGKRRVIYVIPYTSIIEQTAEKFREILGAQNVLEHHAQAAWDGEDNEESPMRTRLRLAAENWDMPVIVTTAVQFFESIYANRPSDCRKLHNMANSVIIFDEAQTLPVKHLQPCIAAISQLVAHFSVSAVLCTATQPFLEEEFARFIPEFPFRELAPAPETLFRRFQRVTYKMLAKLSDDVLARDLDAHAQVLAIVNSRKQARSVHGFLKNGDSFCLTTLLYPNHRRALLAQIRQRLEKGLPCRVVATSLIEAGVDVDFPVVYRALFGLDSIQQAAGRCNRENRNPPEKSVVYIFDTDETPAFFKLGIEITRSVLRDAESPADFSAIRAYFMNYRDKKGAEQLDDKKVVQRAGGNSFPFADIAKDFRLIDQEMKTVYVLCADEADAKPWEKGGALLRKRLWAGEMDRELMRALGQFGVQIYPAHYAALDRAAALEFPAEGVAVLARADLYDAHMGLSPDPAFGAGFFL